MQTAPDQPEDLIARAPDPRASRRLLSALADPGDAGTRRLAERLCADGELNRRPLRDLLPGLGLVEPDPRPAPVTGTPTATPRRKRPARPSRAWPAPSPSSKTRRASPRFAGAIWTPTTPPGPGYSAKALVQPEGRSAHECTCGQLGFLVTTADQLSGGRGNCGFVLVESLGRPDHAGPHWRSR